jgi:hypothetical protein
MNGSSFVILECVTSVGDFDPVISFDFLPSLDEFGTPINCSCLEIARKVRQKLSFPNLVGVVNKVFTGVRN